MEKDTQNAIIVLLSIVIVLVIVIGGGYWCFTYGDGFFIKDATNKTVIPKKKEKIDDGEYSVSLENVTVMVLMEKIPANRDNTISSDDIIYKVGYARNVVSKTSDFMNIYEYYAYKEVLKDEMDNIVGYRYYSDKEKTNLILETIEDIDVFETYSDSLGLYKYSFKYDNRKGYIFDSIEKVK